MPEDLQWIDRPAPLPTRPDDGHKGTFGRVGLLAGSPGMLGAAILCARAALRAGAGSVLCSLPDEQRDAFTVAVPAAMTTVRRSGDELESADAVVIGPGLGGSGGPESAANPRSQSVRSVLGPFVRSALARFSDRPVVLDADGLNAISPLPTDRPLLDPASDPKVVLTPHPGEAARLLGVTVPEVQSGRENALSALIERSGAIVVLKGANTLVGHGSRRFRNRSGNSGLGTAGSGDVLAGVLGALLCEPMDPFEAACHAVDLHGRAGDLVAAGLSRRGVCAEDLPDAVAVTLREDEKIVEGGSESA